MSGLFLTTWTIFTLALGQVGDVRTNPGVAPDTVADVDGGRREVLRGALVDFETAVAMKNDGSAAARQLYQQAMTGFESLADAGVRSGELHFNIGNTQMRLGRVGKAIVSYRRALRLSPGDARIKKNLQSARKMCEVRIEPRAMSAFAEAFFFWHYGTALATRFRVALIAYVLVWVCLVVRLFVLRRSVAYMWLIRSVVLLALIVGASVAWDMVATAHRIEGVLITDGVVLRKGNGEYYEPQLDRSLGQGVEVRVKTTREDVNGAIWYQVELRDGKEGWLEANQVDII